MKFTFNKEASKRALKDVILPALFGAAAFFLAAGAFQKHSLYSLGVNRTGSMEKGIYLVKEIKPGHTFNTWDAVCNEYIPPEWAAPRKYLQPGIKLCKPIAALAGDSIEVKPGVLRVIPKEGAPFEREILAKDSGGLELPSPLQSGVIPEGYVLVLSNTSDRGLDSRYLGLVPTRALTQQVFPLLTYKSSEDRAYTLPPKKE